MHDKDGIVDDHADQNYKSQHCQDIKGLIADQDVDQFESEQSTGGRQRNGEHDDQRIDKIAEQGGHQQIGDSSGQNKIKLKDSAGLGQLIGNAALPDIHALQHSLPGEGFDDFLSNSLHGFLQCDGRRRGDLQRNGPLSFEVPDLGDAGGTMHLGERGHRNNLSARNGDRSVIQCFRS